jgi:hypothetical protein
VFWVIDLVGQRMEELTRQLVDTAKAGDMRAKEIIMADWRPS